MTTTNDHIIAHLVKKGETLESIAKKYGFNKWKPIYLYNTKIRKTIRSSNPDKLQSGITIFIPRSKKGYEKLIRKTVSLMNQL